MTSQILINEQLKKEREEHKKEINHWHPSKLGSCLTGMYLERLDLPPDKDFDERTLRVFAVGHIFEKWYLDTVEKSGAVVDRQIALEWPEFDVRGALDAEIDGLPHELKSKHSRGFWHMIREGGASRHHMMQLWTYLKMRDKKEGRLIYISKDDLGIQEYVVLLNDESLEKEVTNELEILNKAWKEKVAPAIEFNEDDWRAKYCRWHLQCLKYESTSTMSGLWESNSPKVGSITEDRKAV